MSEHCSGIIDEILWMVKKMGDEARFDYCEDLDEYEDYLHELSTEELYDTYSLVEGGYSDWMKKKWEQKNANTT